MWRRLTPLFVAPLLIASPVAARHADPPGAGWMRFEVAAAGRTLAAAMPSEARTGQILTVVIEGDGRAHDRHGHASADPTPDRAVGLDLAQAWPGPTAWLGRPCQYVQDSACKPADWTTQRFSEEAVAMTDAAVSALMSKVEAERVILVGWSGGGVMATLVAARREDVVGLVTIAAPLNVAAWTRSRGLSPLNGLDPAELGPLAFPQIHLSGAFDPLVRPAVVKDTARRLAGPQGQVETWPERHDCCWVARVDQIAAGLNAQP
ncbi:MAG: poly(3-hydroxybutyrate) depolymerase [Pseudoalteromonas distincta]|jgi:poly(3-hydroxybutyrate) depolymerase